MQAVELKWLILNKHNKWFSSRVKFPLARMSVSWFLVCRCTWSGFGGPNWFDRTTRRNSVSPGDVSHCRTSAFNDHLDHCYVVRKHLQSFVMRKLNVWGNTINIIQNVEHSSRLLALRMVLVTVHNVLPRCIVGLNCVSKDWNNQIPQIESGNRVFGFYWIVWNWCLLLTHPTYWDKCMSSTLCWFDWELLDCWTTCPSGRWSTSEPSSSIQSCFKEISGAVEDATGSAKNVSRYGMRVGNAWRRVSASRHS